MMDEGVSISTFANPDDTQPIIRPGAKTQLSTTIEDNTSLVLSSDDEFSQADSNHGPGGSKAGGTSDTRRGLRGAWHKRTQSLQDRMMEKLLKQIIPPEELDGSISVSSSKLEHGIHQKPGFSLPLMATNFRSFNARVGVVFVFQAQLIRLFTWDKPTHTLSLLATYSFLCLHPHLLLVLPLALLLFFVFIPAYLARHPPPPSHSLYSPQHAISGPPIAPPRVIRPATEMSQDFFQNMRDLQNTMGDFSKAHDTILDTLTPWTNFSNEPLSSALFIILSFIICILYLLAPFLPLRHIFLFAGWALTTLLHPSLQTHASKTYNTHIRPASLLAFEKLETWIHHDITLDSTPTTLQVEIFELQHRKASNLHLHNPSSHSSTTAYSPVAEYEPWLYTPIPWEPMTSSRIAGDRPKGSRFLDEIQAPSGWEFMPGRGWMLDLDSAEWVQGRIMGGCEVEVDGERWVYDLESSTDGDDRQGGSVSGDSSGRGEWRRRRWVRIVQRGRVTGESSTGRHRVRDRISHRKDDGGGR